MAAIMRPHRGRIRSNAQTIIVNWQIAAVKEGRKRGSCWLRRGAVSTANGARLINEAIHLNDRAKAACSFHARNVGPVRRTRFGLYARCVYYWSRCTRPVCTPCYILHIYIYASSTTDLTGRLVFARLVHLNISSSRDICCDIYIYSFSLYLSNIFRFSVFRLFISYEL